MFSSNAWKYQWYWWIILSLSFTLLEFLYRNNFFKCHRRGWGSWNLHSTGYHGLPVPWTGLVLWKEVCLSSLSCDFGMTLMASLFTEGMEPSRPCCTVSNRCQLGFGSISEAHPVYLPLSRCVYQESAFYLLPCSLPSFLGKLLIKKEIELPQVNYWVLGLSHEDSACCRCHYHRGRGGTAARACQLPQTCNRGAQLSQIT